MNNAESLDKEKLPANCSVSHMVCREHAQPTNAAIALSVVDTGQQGHGGFHLFLRTISHLCRCSVGTTQVERRVAVAISSWVYVAARRI